MQNAEFKDEESVLKYMTKSEFKKQRGCLLMMTQCLAFFHTHRAMPLLSGWGYRTSPLFFGMPSVHSVLSSFASFFNLELLQTIGQGEPQN
jgi:hypothetical protein